MPSLPSELTFAPILWHPNYSWTPHPRLTGAWETFPCYELHDSLCSSLRSKRKLPFLVFTVYCFGLSFKSCTSHPRWYRGLLPLMQEYGLEIWAKNVCLRRTRHRLADLFLQDANRNASRTFTHSVVYSIEAFMSSIAFGLLAIRAASLSETALCLQWETNNLQKWKQFKYKLVIS